MAKDNTLAELLEMQGVLTKAHEGVEKSRGDKEKASVVYEKVCDDLKNAERGEVNPVRDKRKAQHVSLQSFRNLQKGSRSLRKS